MPFLKADTYSMFRRTRLYGKAGEEVKVIEDGPVMIVEGKKGIRFPVLPGELSGTEEKITATAIEVPSAPVSRKSKKNKPVPVESNTLF